MEIDCGRCNVEGFGNSPIHVPEKANVRVRRGTQGTLAFCSKGDRKGRLCQNCARPWPGRSWETVNSFGATYPSRDGLTAEAAQGRFARLIPGREGLPHEDRGSRSGLYSL
eukprot:g13022.t1